MALVVDDPTKPKRLGTVSGERNEGNVRRNTPARPPQTLPPPRHHAIDFDGDTPPTMDPVTYRAIQTLRNEVVTADQAHTKRLDQVELAQVNLATAATALGTRMNGIEVSHAGMAGEFRGLKETIIKDRDDAREEAKAQANHRRAVGMRWLQILGTAVGAGGVVTVVVLALVGKC